MWLRGIALAAVMIAMLVGTVCSILLIIGKPMGGWDIPVRIGACVGILGMVLVGRIAERK